MSHQALQRRLTGAGIAGLIAGAMLVTAGGTAEAAPAAGCGKDWQLLTIDQTVQFVYDATTSVQAQRDADPQWRTTAYRAFFDFDQIKDGDGFLCVKSTGSTPGQDKQYCGRYGYDPCFSYNVTNINDNTAKGQLTA
jgi:hypothetical protein